MQHTKEDGREQYEDETESTGTCELTIGVALVVSILMVIPLTC